MPFVKLAALDELPEGGSLETLHGDRVIALFRVNGEIRAVDGLCPHQGGPLADGEISGCVVTCPWHGWQFDLKDGRMLSSKKVKIQVFETRVEGSDILVLIP